MTTKISTYHPLPKPDDSAGPAGEGAAAVDWVATGVVGAAVYAAAGMEALVLP